MSGPQRQNGRRALLAEIRRAGPIPRIDLSAKTGISRATVTTITADLLREGLIQEVAADPADTDARRGRPRVDLKICGDARLIAGAKIAHQSVSMVLLDFEGNQLAGLETDLGQSEFDAAGFADMLADVTQQLAEKVGKSLSDVSGLGVGIAGFVDAPRGFVHWSPSLKTRNIELGRILQDRLAHPVYVDNDANLVAMAEKSFGLGKTRKDFIVVTIESGVGMGIVIGKDIYRGTRGCGAEFGHTKVHLDGALCRCGQRGCLEAYVADYALLRDAHSAGLTVQSVDALLSASQAGDADATAVIRKAGRIFAMGLANIINIFDPELIILSGEQMRADHLYAQEVLDAMHGSIVQIDKAPPDVVIHEWGDQMWAHGAAAYALDQVSEAAVAGASDNAA